MEQWRELEQKSQEMLCYGCYSRCWSHGNRTVVETDVCGAWISSMSRHWVPITDRREWGGMRTHALSKCCTIFLLKCRLASALKPGVFSWTLLGCSKRKKQKLAVGAKLNPNKPKLAAKEKQGDALPRRIQICWGKTENTAGTREIQSPK